MNFTEEELREPNLSIAGFELWVYGYQFPESDDYWDGNWLDVMARCTAENAVVQTRGPIIRLDEISSLMVQCEQIHTSLSGQAHMDPMEPNIDLKVIMKTGGQCELLVSITPDHLYQEHLFTFDLDQSYLPPLIDGLKGILNTFPLSENQ